MESGALYIVQLEEALKEEKRYSFLLGKDFFTTIGNEQYPDGKVGVEVVVKHEGSVFDINFLYSGTIVLICDRCLDTFDFPVSSKSTLKVRLGESYRELEDNLWEVEREKGEVNVMWRMFEDIILSLPIQHIHKEGECNEKMENILKEHSPEQEVQKGEDEIDPRWEKLKELLNQ
ncbi:MAG TPA: nucleic acid-binding protein [Porphyromonadaceae bacterium]|nr:nucleic acid-binding protein [Porphyromonadaceae bacterium]